MLVLLVAAALQTILTSGAPSPNREKRDAATFCIFHGREYAHGQNFTVPRSGPCVTYNCHLGSVSPVQLDCQDSNGRCVRKGTERDYLCRREVCEEWGNTIGFRTLYSNCRDQFGECHAIGEPWVRNCLTYVCTRLESNRFQIRTTAVQCADAYGNCKNIGEPFVYPIDGQLYGECYCRLAGTRLQYECYQ